MSMNDTKSLSHTSYRCKYHMIILPKYRRMVIYNKLKKDIGQIIRMLIERKPGCKLLEAEACPDHIHMLLEIPPKYSIVEFMGYLKSKSTLMIFERHANMKYKFGNRKFWSRGYFVDTVEKNEKAIKEYIQNQLQGDKLSDQLSMKEFIDPFTGEPVKQHNQESLFERQLEKALRLSGLSGRMTYATKGPYRASGYRQFYWWYDQNQPAFLIASTRLSKKIFRDRNKSSGRRLSHSPLFLSVL